MFFNSGEHSTKGSLGLPKLKPNKLIASFTGIGLVSANNASIKGRASN